MTTLASLAAGVVMVVTGYTCDPAAGQPYCGVTASGALVGPGVAACPQSIPMGVALVVDGVGTVVCADRYAPWLSDRVDVFVGTVAEAYSITGLRLVTVAS